MAGEDSEPPREVRFRLTFAEWLDWAQVATPVAAEAGSWGWASYWFSWITHVFGMAGWAAAVAFLAGSLLGDGWSTPAFLVAFLAITTLTSVQDTPPRADPRTEAYFRGSLFARASMTVRLLDDGVESLLGEVRITLPWRAVCAIQETTRLVLIAYDETGAGMPIPRRAFPDEAAAERFIADVRGRIGRAARSGHP